MQFRLTRMTHIILRCDHWSTLLILLTIPTTNSHHISHKTWLCCVKLNNIHYRDQYY